MTVSTYWAETPGEKTGAGDTVRAEKAISKGVAVASH